MSHGSSGDGSSRGLAGAPVAARSREPASLVQPADERWAVLETGIGSLTLVATDAGLRNVWFADETSPVLGDRTRVEFGAAELAGSAAVGPHNAAPSSLNHGDRSPASAHGNAEVARVHLAATARQLGAYFDGDRSPFDLTIDPQGTPFQQRVWRALIAIPLGATRTYGAIAAEITAERPEKPTSARAVAAAVGRTPIPIIVPCHRVIGGDGSLTGYRGGLDRKRALLELEGAAITSGGAGSPDARAAVSAGQLPLL